MSECLICTDELGQPGEYRYRVGPADSFDRLGELCVDCGAALFESAGGSSCLLCEDVATRTVRRLVLTDAEANTRNYSPEASRAAFCERHLGDWSPAEAAPATGAAGSPERVDSADADRTTVPGHVEG